MKLLFKGLGFRVIVPLKTIEYGLGYIIIRAPCTLNSIYLTGTIGANSPPVSSSAAD